MMASAKALIPYLGKGIPEMMVPPLQPLVLPKIETNVDSNSAQLKITLEDGLLYGLLDFDFEKFDVDLDKLKFSLAWLYQRLSYIGPYKMVGKILDFDIDSQGTVNATFRKCFKSLKGIHS